MPNPITAYFTAHPDDHEMMLAYHTLEGLATTGPDRLFGYVATDGKASTLGDPALVRAGHRRSESQAGLTSLGLYADNLHYPDLPDGQLSDPTIFTQLTADITTFIRTHHITRAVTLGPDGGDGHPDHIAVHQAVVAACGSLAAESPASPPEILALNAHHAGTHIIPATPATRAAKLRALAANASQFPNVTNIPDLYHPYLNAETYDLS